MNVLYIERSTGDCRSGDWVDRLDLAVPPQRIVVGTGPGSFAGIRSALAFAQGYAIGSGCEVLGLPSACALAEPGRRIAVVGDARRDKFWVALFDGFRQMGDIFQVGREGLLKAVPDDFAVVTPDAQRIDRLLADIFGSRYEGGRTPSAEGLKAFAEANPAALKAEPLPIYLNPAVRD